MRPSRSGLRALALVLASLGPSHAADAPPGEGCDMMCEMRDYLSRDHMVTLVPATEDAAPAEAAAPPPKARSLPHHAALPAPRPKPVAPAPAAPPLRAAARRAPHAAVASLAAVAPRPATAPLAVPPETPSRLMPGGAPIVTPGFSAEPFDGGSR